MSQQLVPIGMPKNPILPLIINNDQIRTMIRMLHFFCTRWWWWWWFMVVNLRLYQNHTEEWWWTHSSSDCVIVGIVVVGTCIVNVVVVVAIVIVSCYQCCCWVLILIAVELWIVSTVALWIDWNGLHSNWLWKGIGSCGGRINHLVVTNVTLHFAFWMTSINQHPHRGGGAAGYHYDYYGHLTIGQLILSLWCC